MDLNCTSIVLIAVVCYLLFTVVTTIPCHEYFTASVQSTLSSISKQLGITSNPVQATLSSIAKQLGITNVQSLYKVQQEMVPVCPTGMTIGSNGICYSTSCPPFYHYNANTSQCLLNILPAPPSATPPIGNTCIPNTKLYNNVCYQACRPGYVLSGTDPVSCVPIGMTDKPLVLPPQNSATGVCGAQYTLDKSRSMCVLNK